MTKKPLVFIVDDEEDLRDMMAFQFNARGYDTATASNGVEALEKLGALNPKLIVLDLNMPKMGGIEFYQRICGPDGRPSHPVLILTARANTEQLFKDFDIDGFMAKPFEIEALVNEAETIISKHSRIDDPAKKKAGVDNKTLKTVYIAENDPAELNAVALLLVNAGYRIAVAKSGTAALELMAAEPPTLALIKLGLPDIAGDLVVTRASRMAKTSDVKFLLYQPRDVRHIRSVRENISEKTGVLDLVEYGVVSELLTAVDSAIQKGKVDGAAKE